MTKQLSNAALQKQLNRLETLGGKELNELLNQLERQKVKLPIDDYPIVDWGISLVRIKLQEMERLMEEVFNRLENKYGNYAYFIAESGWNNYDLNEDEGWNSLYKSSLEYFDNLFDESCGIEHTGVLDEFVPKVKRHLQKFCRDQGNQDFSDRIIRNFSYHYSQRSIESGENYSKSQNKRDEMHSKHYQAIARNLQLDEG